MKKLTDLIKGLELIHFVEKDEAEFNSQDSILYIGNPNMYSEEQKEILFKFNFEYNLMYDCFEYNLD